MKTSKTDNKQAKLLLQELNNLFDFIPPARLSKVLRKIFLNSLMQQKEGFDTDFEQQVMDMYVLFEFLDMACSLKEESK